MRCIAVIEAQRPGLDSVLIWDRDGQLVAFAYQDGRVTMTRPLQATSLEGGITEVQDNFQVTVGQVTKIADWTDTRPPGQVATTMRTRW